MPETTDLTLFGEVYRLPTPSVNAALGFLPAGSTVEQLQLEVEAIMRGEPSDLRHWWESHHAKPVLPPTLAELDERLWADGILSKSARDAILASRTRERKLLRKAYAERAAHAYLLRHGLSESDPDFEDAAGMLVLLEVHRGELLTLTQGCNSRLEWASRLGSGQRLAPDSAAWTSSMVDIYEHDGLSQRDRVEELCSMLERSDCEPWARALAANALPLFKKEWGREVGALSADVYEHKDAINELGSLMDLVSRYTVGVEP